MKCKECKIKSGYEFLANGFYVVKRVTCSVCSKVGSYWADRHFKKVKDE